MSLYTIVCSYNQCNHCGGFGYIQEKMTCPVCLGESVEEDEPCERCWGTNDGYYGEIQVSEVLCRFCENATETFCIQYETESLEECIILIKSYLRGLFRYDPSEDEELEMDETFELNPGNWVLSLDDESGSYECFIIKTAL